MQLYIRCYSALSAGDNGGNGDPGEQPYGDYRIIAAFITGSSYSYRLIRDAREDIMTVIRTRGPVF